MDHDGWRTFCKLILSNVFFSWPITDRKTSEVKQFLFPIKFCLNTKNIASLPSELFFNLQQFIIRQILSCLDV